MHHSIVRTLLLAALLIMTTSAVTHEATGTHDATLIFLHGLGDSGDGWCSILAQTLSSQPGLKIICPNAPNSPVTLNGGMRMPSWHDIKSLEAIDADNYGDYAGLDESIASIKALVQKEIDGGLSPQRVILGGFSQGACITMWTTYTLPTPIGGCLALSGYLPCSARWRDVANADALASTPALQCHGTWDTVVKFKYGQHAFEKLQEAGVKTTFEQFSGMGHTSSPPELAKVAEFVQSILKK